MRFLNITRLLKFATGTTTPSRYIQISKWKKINFLQPLMCIGSSSIALAVTAKLYFIFFSPHLLRSFLVFKWIKISLIYFKMRFCSFSFTTTKKWLVVAFFPSVISIKFYLFQLIQQIFMIIIIISVCCYSLLHLFTNYFKRKLKWARKTVCMKWKCSLYYRN